ncbi:MAG: hypothetical protein F6K21_03170 [Symploca sp. SIO2D2]|nr:hypothetical protein [Symploca sp. SIO2D2]
MPPRKPTISSFVLNETNITNQIVPRLASVIYQDEAGATGLLELELISPTSINLIEGDAIEVRIKYVDSTDEINTGTHIVDEVAVQLAPNIIRVGARAYDYRSGAATKEAVEFTNTRLSEILNEFAFTFMAEKGGTKFPLQVISNAPLGLVVGIASQVGEENIVRANSWLELLKQLGDDYGYWFNIKFGELRFLTYETQEQQSNSTTITPSDCLPTPRFTRRTKNIFESAFVNYKTLTNEEDFVQVSDSTVSTTDILDLRNEGVYYNEASAFERATGALSSANRNRQTVRMKTEGNGSYMVGANVSLTGFTGNMVNGKYAISRAIHRLDSDGWTTDLEMYMIFI